MKDVAVVVGGGGVRMMRRIFSIFVDVVLPNANTHTKFELLYSILPKIMNQVLSMYVHRVN